MERKSSAARLAAASSHFSYRTCGSRAGASASAHATRPAAAGPRPGRPACGSEAPTAERPRLPQLLSRWSRQRSTRRSRQGRLRKRRHAVSVVSWFSLACARIACAYYSDSCPRPRALARMQAETDSSPLARPPGRIARIHDSKPSRRRRVRTCRCPPLARARTHARCTEQRGPRSPTLARGHRARVLGAGFDVGVGGDAQRQFHHMHRLPLARGHATRAMRAAAIGPR